MSSETDIAVIKTELKSIKKDTTEIRECLFGNGHPGLKVDVTTLKVKFWIVFILLLPVAGWALRGLVK